MVAPLHIGLDGISFSYPGGKRVLTDISFAVPSGSVTGLIGENGAGKSTLLSVISRELVPDTGELITPPVTGFIAQETSLPFTEPASMLIDAAVAELRNVEADITRLGEAMSTAEGADNAALAADFDLALARAEQSGVWELDARIATVLAGLGLANVPLSTPLGEMSGGQRRRFALATLLLRPVDAMVLDEPTNHLDDEAVDFLVGELEAFKGPVLVASHNRYFLDTVCDGIVDLDLGLGAEGGFGEETRQGARFSGAFSDYLAAREDRRRRWESDYAAQEHERARLEKAAEQDEEDIFHSHENKTETRKAAKFYSDKAAKTVGNRRRSARLRLEALEREAIPAPPARLAFRGVPEHTATSIGVPAIVTRGLAVPERLAPLDLKVQPGEQLLIEGPNGSGKSTLLKILDGTLTDYEGECLIPEEYTVARLEQDDNWQDLSVTAAEAFAARTGETGPTLVEMGLMTQAQSEKKLEDLSLGQRRRVSLGIILSSPPDLLLLDEPTNHLSLALAEELEHALLDFAGTVVITSHDRWVRRQWRERIRQKDGRARILTLSTMWTGEVWRDETD
ncbi:MULTISPECIES: ABC-F family ATP-binding cassette domain-containing protein [Corynebacterium]|uniref:ABC-F family ATP-binding cassette domain-containing protein n=1 Tax=Corynebacterium TaxID=1716 RepID=UPI0008A556FF|nr:MULTISPECIES: ABC-F family ATP-binding cassette domain-containing protein [Corynebacterium]MCG7277758.1 ATP-binding cassette domain-containing protein [Corynebacterium imitans]MDK8305735.1 ABC-F family ATP-binding cassette domain-containing protein [Corynebacterium imitans]MDK8636799.1 ABC-F family ATP-binding cassette domain-containing protein [Corynebacterium imitans]MDK8772414.1 ABC-F family ATP-binding cassette domain-containing protein [Corynebacterium imitans]OFP36112.1 ABC transporte